MKTKPAKPIEQSFPTCGEVFYFWARRLEFLNWIDAFSPEKEKARDEENIKATSDNIRDWANEKSGRTPSRRDFENVIRENTTCAEFGDSLTFVMTVFWEDTLTDHCVTVRENTTYLGRGGTRAWYARWQSSRGIITAHRFQRLLCRLGGNRESFLNQPFDVLLSKAWSKGSAQYPLTAACFAFYVSSGVNETDPKNITVWSAGEVRPTFSKLGDLFRGHSRLPEIVLAFGFTRALEELASLVREESGANDWEELQSMLLRQAACLRHVDEHLRDVERQTAQLNLDAFENYLRRANNQLHAGKIAQALGSEGDNLLDIRLAEYRVFKEHVAYLGRGQVPDWFASFLQDFQGLWEASDLGETRFSAFQLRVMLGAFKNKWASYLGPFAGLVYAIEARMELKDEPLGEASLVRAMKLYQKATDSSRYRAGVYTHRVFEEALGLAALLYGGNKKLGRGLKPWIKKTMAWLILIGFEEDGTRDFDSNVAGFVSRLEQFYRRKSRTSLIRNFEQYMERIAVKPF